MSRQEETVFTFKPSAHQWEYLDPMGKRTRSAYVRRAVLAYIAEHPRITAIPLHEPPDEPIRHLPVRFSGGPAVMEWLERIPNQMRSYMVRCILNWYRARTVEDPQAKLDLDGLQSTGS